MTSKTRSTKRVCEIFFTREPTTGNVFTCRCGVKRKRSGTSNTNLISHILSAHADAYQDISSGSELGQSQLDQYFSAGKPCNLYGWLDLVINGLLPFSFVEKQIVRTHVKHEPISLTTFMKYMTLLTAQVEQKISLLLPDTLALVFDGWTTDATHYLAVFATFPIEGSDSYGTRLLTISPMGDETTLTADEHFEFLSYILDMYGKTWSNVVCLIGDNASTNKALSNKAKIPFIGCGSHRMNLAMKIVLQSFEPILAKINCIMVKLRGLILAAKLRKLTYLKAKVRNATRWSSTFEMVVRYTQIREFLPSLESEEIDLISLSPSENRRVDTILLELVPLESVNKKLQSDSTSVSDTRALFDATIEAFPDTTNKLLYCSTFESAVIKLQRGNSTAMSREEANSVKKLIIKESSVTETVDEGLSFAERALKRQKCIEHESRGKYMDSSFLIPTSNVCERLFSKVGYTFTQRRKGMCPANLEGQVFLHLNKDLWGRSDVNILTLR